jgi:hypothetical protein
MNRLPETTTQGMVGLPKHGNPVGAVWARLAELERAGQEDSAVIAVLRAVLLHHQPPQHGRCPACPRSGLRRQRFPCVVWHRAHGDRRGPEPQRDARLVLQFGGQPVQVHQVRSDTSRRYH